MRRGRKMKAMCEGLLFMNFGKYLSENHCRLLFLGFESKVTTDKLKLSFVWKEIADSVQEDAKQWFLEFVDGSSETYLKKILKFSTGFEDINNLRGNEIYRFLARRSIPQGLSLFQNNFPAFGL